MDEWQRSRMTAGMGVPKQSPLGSKRDRRTVDPFLPRTRCPCVTFTPLKIRRPWVPWHFEVLPREGGEIHRTHWNPYAWNEVSSMFPPWINSFTHAIGTPGTSKMELHDQKKIHFVLLRVTHQWSIWRKFYDFYIFGDYPMVWSHQSFFGTYCIYCHQIII